MTEIELTGIGVGFGSSAFLSVLIIVTAVIALGGLLYDRNSRKRR